MANKLRAAQDIMGVIDGILELPDSVFGSKTSKDMISSITNQINIEEAAKQQQKEFLSENLSYDQVVMLCSDMEKDIQDFIEDIENLQAISEKKVFLKDIFSKFLSLPEHILKDYPRYDASIPVELCHPNAKLPTYAHDGDAGADVYAVEDSVIHNDETVLLPTGLKMAIPKGWMISVRPRSGLSLKTGLRISNSPGTVDANYLSEIGIIASNTGLSPVEIHTGDRIAQFILERAYKAEFALTDDVTKHTTENRANAAGEQGFGSTDKV